MQITDVAVGDGKEAVKGKAVTVHYTGWLYDDHSADHQGPQFDSSRDRNDPFVFALGAGSVIKGWDEGVAKLRVGDHAILVIPGKLAYGPRGVDVIPPDATLIFIVEVVDVKASSLARNDLKTVMTR
jgi:FKBP-type peptidyl-prolyl cis-trans isomerase FkpA